MNVFAYVLIMASALSTAPAPEISGSLVDYNGKPAPKVTVSVVSVTSNEVLGRTVTGQDGSFSFTGIAPGLYGVEARTNSACAMSSAIGIKPGFTKIVSLKLSKDLCGPAVTF